jgi:glycosyltransferase involved in cell wall biosynthesis
MISIVTGTLNRQNILDHLIKNTVENCSDIELVLIDGGSTDGTIEFIKSLNNPQIKLVEVGCRSSYPHFMNLGIRNATHEIVCQWNDDTLLVNDWQEVIDSLDDDHDAFIFSWKYEHITNFGKHLLTAPAPIHGPGRWIIHNEKNTKGPKGEIVMNYGLYRKKVFREIGMYHPLYEFYYADGDMSERAWCMGYKIKCLDNIKVVSLSGISKNVFSTGGPRGYHRVLYDKNRELYNKKIIPDCVEILE